MTAPRPSPEQMLVHFYRAVVTHSDVWRQRLDATTNWAAATTAGMVTFTFGVQAPHFILLLALAFDSVFLLMEARRYQTYDLWRGRLLVLNRYMVGPILDPVETPPEEMMRAKLAELARDLGRTSPKLSLLHAAGFRIYRNYGFLFGIVVLAWFMKLSIHPRASSGWEEVVERARIGSLSGEGAMAIVLGFFASALILAFVAPNERMVDWTESRPVLRRLVRTRRPDA